MERVLKQVVKVLASNTNYATLITGPTYHHNKVKFIQLSKLNEEQLLAVIVVEGNLVKNQIVNLDETICQISRDSSSQRNHTIAAGNLLPRQEDVYKRQNHYWRT